MDRTTETHKASHNAFNDILNNTIQRGQNLLSRNFINYDYVESERKDLREPADEAYSAKKNSALKEQSDVRYEVRGRADKSPLKEYINSKIDEHIGKLRGGATAERQAAQPQANKAEEKKNVYFESQVYEQQDYREDQQQDYREDQQQAYDEIHDARNEQQDQDFNQTSGSHADAVQRVKENIGFQAEYDPQAKHKAVRYDELSASHFRHRQEVDRVATKHHDSPARDSKLFNYTEHEVQEPSNLSGTYRRTYQADEDLGHPDEDNWAKTSRSIDKLHQKHSELEKSRLLRESALTGEAAERDLFERTAQDSHALADRLRNQDLIYSSPEKRFNDTLRLRALDDMSQAQVGLNESVVTQSNSYLINRYHTMKQNPPRISRQTLKFAATRINPPRCLLDVLEALFSLIYGVYDKVDHGFFANKDRKYYEYKAYFQSLDDLFDILKHLKLYLETQGLPVRNVTQADAALVRYKKTVKRIEAKPYVEGTEEIASFVLYFLEYYNILRVASPHQKLNLEPLSKKDAERGTVTTSPQYLKNATHREWRESVYEAAVQQEEFSAEELVELLKNTVKRKTWVIIKGTLA